MKTDVASATAYAVALGVLDTARRPERSPPLPPGWAAPVRAILDASETGRGKLAALDRWWWPLAMALAELGEPGFAAHCVLRKRLIERRVRAAIADGCRQVINIGAGFDPLAWRLHAEHPAVRFIEIDHPATQAEKAQALVALPADGAGDLRWQAADLSVEPLADVLRAGAADPERPTVFIIEGVLPYLQPAAVRATFDALAGFARAPGRVIFTYVEAMADYTWLARLYFAVAGEPMRWLQPTAGLGALLAGCGCRLEETLTPQALRARLAPNARGRVHRVEHLAIAAVGAGAP